MRDTSGTEEYSTAIMHMPNKNTITLRGSTFHNKITITLDPLTKEDKAIIEARTQQFKKRITKRVRAWRYKQEAPND